MNERELYTWRSGASSSPTFCLRFDPRALRPYSYAAAIRSNTVRGRDHNGALALASLRYPHLEVEETSSRRWRSR
jgi:hypothetical protein